MFDPYIDVSNYVQCCSQLHLWGYVSESSVYEYLF